MGEVRFRGKNILTSGPGRRYDHTVRGTGISMVFQEPAIALNPVMKVGRQITDAIAEHKGLSKRAAHDLAIELYGPGRHRRSLSAASPTTRSSSPGECASA